MRQFLANLKLAHKFMLIGAVAALMALLPCVLAVNTFLDQLHMAKSELSGIDPARDVLSLVQLTQQHRGQSAAVLGGDASVAAARQEKQALVERVLGQAKASVAALGDARLAGTVGEIERDWQALAADVGGQRVDGPQSFARHTALVGRELALLEDVANASGVVLHPDAPGYFLQLGVLTHLPRLTEALGQARAQGVRLLVKGEATPEQKARVDMLMVTARRYADDAAKALALAGQHDAALGQAIAAPLAAARAAAEEGVKLVDERIVRAEPLSQPAAEFSAGITRVIDQQFALIDASLKQLEAQLQHSVWNARQALAVLLGATAGLLLLGLWIMWAVTHSISESIAHALGLAEAVAAGDLNNRIEGGGRDEIGRLLQALGAMNGSLARVVSSVRSCTDLIATGSRQIAGGNADLSQRTEAQASSLQQTAASMEQMSATVHTSADTAQQATQLAGDASRAASKGGEVVGQVVGTMREINAASHKIAQITGLIDGIAFQTNILALNAAVEAARAGDAGRGFAVVAGEVRTLAQRSAGAAREIKGLIEESLTKAQAGSALADQAGQAMGEIVGQVERVRQLIADINSATNQQADGIGQINEAVTQLDRATQQNAALVEESAAAASSLQQQAEQLVQAVAAFRLPEGVTGRAVALA
jgi:methyl-accepting chemotaxis protein